VRALGFLLLLVVACASIGSLVAGAGYVEWTLPGGVPVGNVLAALGLCAPAGAAWMVSPPASWARRFASIALGAAIAWLPVSVVLAGNLALNFSGGRGTLWLAMSAGVGLVVLVALAWAAVACVVAFIRRRKM
jgi:hypothetical protein